MSSQLLSSREAFRMIVAQGVRPVLEPAGFQRAKNLSWVRRTPELEQVVALPRIHEWYHAQWGVLSPETAPILWGHEVPDGDVSFAVFTGHPQAFRHPAPGQSFRLEKTNEPDAVDVIAKVLAQDLIIVEERLRMFQTRRGLREYLLENRDVKDRRGVLDTDESGAEVTHGGCFGSR